jgi:hypothetical protein
MFKYQMFIRRAAMSKPSYSAPACCQAAAIEHQRRGGKDAGRFVTQILASWLRTVPPACQPQKVPFARFEGEPGRHDFRVSCFQIGTNNR